MKKLLYIVIGLLFMSCSKDDLDQSVIYENLYTIQDDPSDPVRHRIWQIYEKYGAPVYFNDTIGKYYVKDDINGNPFYRYELLDLNWNFYSDNSDKITYKKFYQTDTDQQMISLDFVEKLLEKISIPLQPYAIFLADSIVIVDKKSGSEHNDHYLQFNLLSLNRLHKRTEVLKDSLIDKITRDLIGLKIPKYKSYLNSFHSVCKSGWYNTSWKNLGLDMKSSYGPSIFTERSKQILMAGSKYEKPWTEEEVEAERDRIRGLIGTFGFVGGSSYSQAGFSPDNTARDLDTYMAEVLSCNRAEFVRRWGNCPLVMKKYEVLYNLLKDELDYEL